MTLFNNVIALPFSKDRLATVSVTPSGEGFASEWWISGRSGMYLRVLGHLSLPVYGNTTEIALACALRFAPQIEEMTEGLWGGSGVPTGVAPTEHVKNHMDFHREYLENSMSILTETAGYYELLSGFRVNNPAVVIAQHTGVSSVRTVQDRISRGRKDGLIAEHGQGRSRRAS